MNAGRRHETLRSETKNFITPSTAISMDISMSVPIILAPKSYESDADRYQHMQWLHYRRGTLNLENLNLLYEAVRIPDLCSRGSHYLYCPKP